MEKLNLELLTECIKRRYNETLPCEDNAIFEYDIKHILELINKAEFNN